MGIRLVYILLVALLPLTSALADCDLEVSFIKGSNEGNQKDAFSEDIFNQLKHLPFSSHGYGLIIMIIAIIKTNKLFCV